MIKQLTVTFIICSYNRAAYLDDTLGSLIEHQPTDSSAYEFLVVDNNSTDNTAEVVKKHQKIANKDDKYIRYIKETKQGLSFARNRGITEATATHVVFLDDDIQATPSLIPAWISFFETNPNAVAGGGKIHVQFDDPRPSWMSHFLLPLLGHHDLGDRTKIYPKTKYPFGGNMGFKKSVFEQVGIFDIELGRKGESLNAGEEKELFRRIRSKYKNIYYVPDAFLYHRVGSSRLTKEYIEQQALGLGQSMWLRLREATTNQKLKNWITEAAKLLGSFPLAIGYIIILQPSKAAMLFQFRWWIWKGYNQSS
ncbi:glycosyltransferase [Fodinibius halophilus]|uniref:Glycosyltransferase family 2 protein n=1 Tax=Fodinibius halophilus TaxID=1736908 RepID=A0A6M1TN59_9BACT|nr:glycosyltransferase [Fodinibius halophilus]NGP89790.1 glycosyltransferase family 2 protein [Fodinibius halophilus]